VTTALVLTIRLRTALVLAVTATQRLCLGAGLVGYAQWLRRDLTTAVTDQVLRDNRAVAAQFARNWRRLRGGRRAHRPAERRISLHHRQSHRQAARSSQDAARPWPRRRRPRRDVLRTGGVGGTITDLAAAGSFGGTGHVGDESHVIGTLSCRTSASRYWRISASRASITRSRASWRRASAWGSSSRSDSWASRRHPRPSWSIAMRTCGEEERLLWASSDGERERRRVHVR